jgi:hypothetical protein
MKKKILLTGSIILLLCISSLPLFSQETGDVNGDGSINIVDALLVAQFYVGLDPQNFQTGAGDTNCDGTINIVDALLIAQFYVGLITEFSGCTATPVPEPTSIPSVYISASVRYPTTMFSHEFAHANGFASWTIASLPSWLTTPSRTSGSYEDIVTFEVDWDQIPEGNCDNGFAIFSIQGEPTGQTEYNLRVTACRADAQATPTPVVEGTPVPTVPAMAYFQGYVYVADSYEPISGASISLVQGDRNVTTTSAADGYYELGLSVGYPMDMVLSVTAHEYIGQEYQFIQILGTLCHDFPMKR